MQGDGHGRTLAKLVLLQQANVDKEVGSCAKAVLAVVLDHTGRGDRTFIGPTAIARITGFNEKSVRQAMKIELEPGGYIRTEHRSKRSNWIYPNLDHAEKCGRLMTRSEGQLRVHRPAKGDRVIQITAGVDARNIPPLDDLAGVDAGDSGCTAPEERVPTPAEPIIEPVIESLKEQKHVQSELMAGAGNRFEDFWKAYPRKVNKKGAEKVWTSKKLETIAKTIVADVIARVADAGQWTDPKYIPHPTTYLNGARWEDEWTPSVQMAPLGTLPRETNADAINAASMRRLGITR